MMWLLEMLLCIWFANGVEPSSASMAGPDDCRLVTPPDGWLCSVYTPRRHLFREPWRHPRRHLRRAEEIGAE